MKEEQGGACSLIVHLPLQVVEYSCTQAFLFIHSRKEECRTNSYSAILYSILIY